MRDEKFPYRFETKNSMHLILLQIGHKQGLADLLLNKLHQTLLLLLGNDSKWLLDTILEFYELSTIQLKMN